MDNKLTVTFPTIKKRGLIGMFLGAWDGPVLFFLLSGAMALGSIAGAITQKSMSPLSGVFVAAIFGGLGYLQYKKALEGTSYVKQVFKMRVLRKDKLSGNYRYLTANEYMIRQVLAVAYMPVAFALGTFPMMLGAAIGGGVAAATNSNRYQGSEYNGSLAQKYEDDANNARAAAATAAGAAVGAALTDKLVTKYPWLFTLHDKLMDTIVIEESMMSKAWFAEHKEIRFDSQESIRQAA